MTSPLWLRPLLLVLALCLASTPVYGYTFDDYVSYWGVDTEAIDFNILIDNSANANHGTLLNGTAVTPDDDLFIGYGLIFDGVDDYVNVPHAPSLDITGDITIAAWIKRGSLDDYGSILAKAQGNTRDYDFYFASTDNRLRFFGTGITVASTGVVGDVDSHFVAVTRRGSTVTFYIDFAPAGTATMSGPFQKRPFPVRIGTNKVKSEGHFKGHIDEVRLYNRALAPTEIVSLSGSNTYTDNVSHWTFDEGEGTTAFDHNPGNSNNGTLVNGVAYSSHSFGGSSLSFDGVDDYVNVPHAPSLDITGDITIAAWIHHNLEENFSLEYGGGILAKTDGTARDYAFSFDRADHQLWFSGANSTAVSTGVVPDLDPDFDSWHFVAVTRRGSTVTFYIDGIAAGTATMSGPFQKRLLPLWIGADGLGAQGPFKGIIDEVRLYNRALTAIEMANLYCDYRSWDCPSSPAHATQ